MILPRPPEIPLSGKHLAQAFEAVGKAALIPDLATLRESLFLDPFRLHQIALFQQQVPEIAKGGRSSPLVAHLAKHRKRLLLHLP